MILPFLLLFFVYSYTQKEIKTSLQYALLAPMLITQTAYSEQIVTFFAHGIHDSSKQALPYAQTMDRSPYIVTGPLVTFEFDDSIAHSYGHINFPYGSLGQENELEKMKDEWDKMNEQFPHADGFILLGVSRGASAIINFVAKYQPKKVKALILESAFDTIENIITHRAERLGVPEQVVYYAINALFWKFSHQGLMPLHCINDIPDIPMLFITVEDDHSVPVHGSKKLYDQRVACGNKKSHFFTLKQGRHGKLMKGPDNSVYQNVVHAFYKKYGLPHHTEYACAGDHYFLKS